MGTVSIMRNVVLDYNCGITDCWDYMYTIGLRWRLYKITWQCLTPLSDLCERKENFKAVWG